MTMSKYQLAGTLEKKTPTLQVKVFRLSKKTQRNSVAETLLMHLVSVKQQHQTF